MSHKRLFAHITAIATCYHLTCNYPFLSEVFIYLFYFFNLKLEFTFIYSSVSEYIEISKKNALKKIYSLFLIFSFLFSIVGVRNFGEKLIIPSPFKKFSFRKNCCATKSKFQDSHFIYFFDFTFFFFCL